MKEFECEFLEEDKIGDICHASDEDECINPFYCSAVYDKYGNYLNEEN